MSSASAEFVQEGDRDQPSSRVESPQRSETAPVAHDATVGSSENADPLVAAEIQEDDPKQYDWVSSAILKTKARLVRTNPLSYYVKYIDAPDGQKWRFEEAEDLTICTVLSKTDLGFFFQGRTLELMGIRIPLIEFQQAVLRHLRLAPSQLAPNGWGFTWTFELLMGYLQRDPSVRVFIAVVKITRLSEKDDNDDHAHVGL